MINIFDSSSLNEFFIQKVKDLPCQNNTKSYIVQLMSKPIDLSKESITLAFAKAKSNYDFAGFQAIGDWLLLTKTAFPKHLRNASSEYYDAIAQNAYYTCYRIVNKQWVLFEELADFFPEIVKKLQIKFSQ